MISTACTPTGVTRTAPAAAAPPTLPAAPYETTWIGYEAALPWIRISPPLLRAVVVRVR